MSDVKAWLSRGFWLKKEMEQILRMRGETFDRLTKLTQNLSESPTSGTKDPHKYDILAELDIKLAEKEAEIDKARLEIYNVISEVKDTKLRTILMARYCECMSWQEIQAIMHYDQRWVYRLHGQALQAVEPLIKKAI